MRKTPVSSSSLAFSWKDSMKFTRVLRKPKKRFSTTTVSVLLHRNSGGIKSFFSIYDGIQDERIGCGSFGHVFLVEKKADKTQYAAKIMPKENCNKSDIEYFRSEGEYMKKLKHPNIVKCFESFEDSSDVILILEFAKGGDLCKELLAQKDFRFAEEQTKIILKQMLSAMCYLRRKKIAHRDLKLEQFLLMSPQDITKIKLTDFGFAKSDEKTFIARLLEDPSKQKLYQTAMGSKAYTAPEVFDMKNNGYTYKADVWSLGYFPYKVGVLEIYDEDEFSNQEVSESGQGEDNTLEAFQRFLETGLYEFYPYKLWESIDAAAKGFIARMLKYNPEERAGFEDLSHDPWITQKYFSRTAPARFHTPIYKDNKSVL
eukprot:snap_masked-scaffold_4-processed-gene-11.40-mRNA-1 protein AED:1.00 eAED:1.00 QI:0/0/0/0/1/1/2/0/371